MDWVAASPLRVFGDDDELLGPYVPTLVLQWLRDRPEERHRVVDCTLVFADISGFTRMTEMLGARGKIGAEEGAELINVTFEPLLAVAYEYGAGLIKWGGDATLLLFQGAEHAARGCRAAYEMQRVMRATGACARAAARCVCGCRSASTAASAISSSSGTTTIASWSSPVPP
jgi:class 3 adenylate cyclase